MRANRLGPKLDSVPLWCFSLIRGPAARRKGEGNTAARPFPVSVVKTGLSLVDNPQCDKHLPPPVILTTRGWSFCVFS